MPGCRSTLGSVVGNQSTSRFSGRGSAIGTVTQYAEKPSGAAPQTGDLVVDDGLNHPCLDLRYGVEPLLR